MTPSGSDDDVLIERLFTEEDRLPREAVDKILRRAETLAPRLAAIIHNEGLWGDASPRGWAPLHATFLLAAVKPAGTYETILRALDRAGEYAYDYIVDHAPAILAGFAAPDLEPIRTLFRDRTRSESLRRNAGMALAGLAQARAELRTPASAEIRAVTSDPTEEKEFRLYAAGLLFDLGDPQDRDLLLSFGKNDFFDARSVAEAPSPSTFLMGDWLSFYDPEEIEARRVGEIDGPELEESMDPENILPPDPAAEVLEAATADPDLPPPPLRRTEPKIGRNDPCPCGSGTKYKKCCGK